VFLSLSCSSVFKLHLYWLLWCVIFIFCFMFIIFILFIVIFVSFYRFCRLISLKTFPTEYYFFLRFSTFIFRWQPFSSFLSFSILESRDGRFNQSPCRCVCSTLLSKMNPMGVLIILYRLKSFDCSLRNVWGWGSWMVSLPLRYICLIIFIYLS